MILLDTHIWYWWVEEPQRLSASQTQHVSDNESVGLGVSIISCWEVAKAASRNRIKLGLDVAAWIRRALAYPGVQLLDLTPEIAIEANSLPGTFHRDPADQILVATARVMDIPMLTADGKILSYPHVKLV